MLGTLRLYTRLAAAILFLLLMGLVALLIRLFTLRRPLARYHAICRGMSFWGHGLARIFGMKIRVHGTPPKSPFILVTNHISYTDILLLSAVSPSWFISKSEVADWPGVGLLARSANTLFLDRKTRRDVHRMNHRIADLVRGGGAVCFFPEGTTSDGTDILPFKPSLLQPAIELDIPVHVAAIAYQTPPSIPPPEHSVAWIGDQKLTPHAMHLLAAPGFTAHIRFAEETAQAPDRKALARRARDILLHLHRDLNASLQSS